MRSSDDDQPTAARGIELAGLAAVAALFLALFRQWNLQVDDAFISFRYAENWSGGRGLVYNPGEVVEGFSNPLWVALLATGKLVGLPVELAATLLGLAAGLASLGLVYAGCRRWLGTGALAALGATLSLAASVSWTFWANSGLETPLFGLLVTATWLVLWGPAATSNRGSIQLGILAAMLALTRPEGIAVAAALPFALAWLRRPPPAVVLRCVAVGWGLLLVLLAVRLWYYGAALPNPYYAKVELTLSSMARGFEYCWRWGLAEGVLLLAPLWLLAPAKSRRLASLLAVLAGYLVFVVWAGGDGLYRYRFGAHVLPLMALALGAGLERAMAHSRAGALAAVALLLAALSWPWLAARGDFFAGRSLAHWQRNEERWSLIGRALASTTPPDLTLATNVAGRLPFYSRRPNLDLLGLTDSVIARTPVTRFGSGYAGHEKANPGYVLERAPDLIYFSVLDGLPPDRFTRLDDLARHLDDSPLYRYGALLAAAEFRARYRPAFLDVGLPDRANVLVRVDGAARRMHLESLAVAEWHRY
ncbi:MAG: hypothetical protein O7A04_12050 [Acidobacteria bacterium]|nr:hypothetical protein [Acidobacteriota bacterium]